MTWKINTCWKIETTLFQTSQNWKTSSKTPLKRKPSLFTTHRIEETILHWREANLLQTSQAIMTRSLVPVPQLLLASLDPKCPARVVLWAVSTLLFQKSIIRMLLVLQPSLQPAPWMTVCHQLILENGTRILQQTERNRVNPHLDQARTVAERSSLLPSALHSSPLQSLEPWQVSMCCSLISLPRSWASFIRAYQKNNLKLNCWDHLKNSIMCFTIVLNKWSQISKINKTKIKICCYWLLNLLWGY